MWERHGVTHEQTVFTQMSTRHEQVTCVDDAGWGSAEELHAAEQSVRHAMSQADITCIYQPVLFDRTRGMSGRADFLERSATGRRGWEVVEVKSAGTPTGEYLFQAGWYSLQVARLQGFEPGEVHVVCGDKRRWSFDGPATHRLVEQILARWLHQAGHGGPGVLNGACASCDWKARCDEVWTAADDVGLVAGVTADLRGKLVAGGVDTAHGLVGLDQPVDGISEKTQAHIVKQAAAHVRTLEEGKVIVELLEHDTSDEPSGLWLLPEPDPGDVFIDFEGYPLYQEAGGLEYLVGAAWFDGTDWQYQAWWAHDRYEEFQLLEAFVDWLSQRREQHPGMHAYHYHHYERTALTRLAGRHGTREDEVGRLAGDGVLVDLLVVVKQGLVVGTSSYSLKQVEQAYRQGRQGQVTSAVGSIVEYDEWLRDGDHQRLVRLEEYNRDDCVSTGELHDWLEVWRSRLVVEQGVDQDKDQAHREAAATRDVRTKGRERKEPDPLAGFERQVARRLAAEPALAARPGREEVRET
jgi:uncharacterized protein